MGDWWEAGVAWGTQLSAVQFSSVAQACANSLQPHGLQHARPPCPSPTPGVYQLLSIELVMPSNHLILCCHLLFLLQSFPASGCFPMSCLFASRGKSIGPSALASVFPMNIQGEFPLGLTGFISLQSKGLSRVYSSITIQRHQCFNAQVSLLSNSHICTWLLETTTLTVYTFVGKVMSLLFKMLSRLVIAFLPRSKHLLLLWLQSPSAVILEPKKIKSVIASTFSPIRLSWSDGIRCNDFSFLNVEF